MRLKLELNGVDGSTEVHTFYWPKPLMDFPKLIRHGYITYEWVFYDEDKDTSIDYRLMFSELMLGDPRNYDPHTHLRDIINFEEICECGGKILGHPGHSSWCSSFRRS
jgi:hypothetical protein